MTKPGVQKPHCEPWHSTIARCTGWSVSAALPQALHGEERLAVQRGEEEEAGVHGAQAHRAALELAQHHRARAAVPLGAALLGPAAPLPAPEPLQHGGGRVDRGDRSHAAVEDEAHGVGHERRRYSRRSGDAIPPRLPRGRGRRAGPGRHRPRPALRGLPGPRGGRRRGGAGAVGARARPHPPPRHRHGHARDGRASGGRAARCGAWQRARALRLRLREDVFGKDGGVEAGVELLPKPFTPAALLERVRTVLDAPVPARRVTGP